MNPENSLRSNTKSLRNPSLTNEALNNSLLPDKLNPHRISKRAYTNPAVSHKTLTNVKKNSSNRRAKLENSSYVQKSATMPDMNMQINSNSQGSVENLEQFNGYASIFSHEAKENFIFENSSGSQNFKETPYEQNLSKTRTFNSSQVLSREFNSSRKSQQESLKLNRFSSFGESDTYSVDSRLMHSQDLIDCQNFSGDDNSHSFRDVKASNPFSQQPIGQLTHDINDYSDRETAEETVSCISENNIGTNTRPPKKLMRAASSLEKYVADSKGPFLSQEISICTMLDCEETLGFHSAVLNEKKEDSVIPYDIEFEQEFTLFSSTNTTPINKQIDDLSNSQMSQSKLRPIQEELDAFNPESNPCAFDSDTINYLIKRENDYAPDPHFLVKRQTSMTWSMRAILLDWMMEVSTEFGLKRESFHYAVNYVDRYLTAALPVQKWELQLVGVTTLYMAAKVEEIYPPRVSSFARSTDNAYRPEEILRMELHILKALKWLLTPPTLNTWANWYMNQWDLYIERSEYARNHPLVLPLAETEDIVQFKQSNQKSYGRFREMMQIIDCALLDAQTLQYKPRALIASIMYILLGKYFGCYTNQQIFENFPYNSQYLLDTNNSFNELFDNFLVYSFGFELIDLLPSIQYVSTYINLPVSLDLPKVVKMNKENVLEGHFEEFLAFQTHHSYNLQYIKKRPRNNF